MQLLQVTYTLFSVLLHAVIVLGSWPLSPDEGSDLQWQVNNISLTWQLTSTHERRLKGKTHMTCILKVLPFVMTQVMPV